MLQCIAVCCSVRSASQCAAVCCSALQCVLMRCSMSQCVAMCRSVLLCVVVCGSVSQCVAVRCVLRRKSTYKRRGIGGSKTTATKGKSIAVAYIYI